MASPSPSADVLRTSEGDLGRPTLAGSWPAPAKVELGVDELVWSAAGLDERRSADRNMLERFVRLADASPERVCAFAARYGPLRWPADSSQVHPQLPARRFRESLDNWHELAVDAGALLDVAGTLRMGRRPTLEQWRRFTSLSVTRSGKGLRASFDRGPDISTDDEEVIALCLTPWLAPVGVTLAWHRQRKRGPELLLQPNGLIGALGLQLAQAVATTRGLALCSECGESYAPARQPRVGQRNYCEGCRSARAPQLAAERAYRARGAGGRGSHSGSH